MTHLNRIRNFMAYYEDCFFRAKNHWSNWVLQTNTNEEGTPSYYTYASYEQFWGSDFLIKIIPQIWSNGAKGWPGGLATQAFCTEDVVVFYSIRLNIAFVYICKFAYSLVINEYFLKILNSDSNISFPGVDRVKNSQLDIIQIGKNYENS